MIDIHQDVKVEAFKLLGREAFSEKKYDDAIRYYNSALELNPHTAEIYRERGGVYYAMGDKHHAEEDMQAYFRENPEAVEELSGAFQAEGREHCH